jgi:hypothetical protein
MGLEWIEGKALPANVVEDRATRINLVKSELAVLDEKTNSLWRLACSYNLFHRRFPCGLCLS